MVGRLNSLTEGIVNLEKGIHSLFLTLLAFNSLLQEHSAQSLRSTYQPAWPAHSKITKAACLPSRPPRPNIWESSQGSLGSPDKYWCPTDAGLWTKLLMGGGQESWAEHKLSLIPFFVYVAYLSILILLWKQVKEMFLILTLVALNPLDVGWAQLFRTKTFLFKGATLTNTDSEPDIR